MNVKIVPTQIKILKDNIASKMCEINQVNVTSL